ncbi:lipoyl domain-containing protein [Micromonospora sp. NPDC049460]|uniref:lipoyl domain-containing protein n=1 Tax=unclassified Micromonospora TaxID=2617518 RepID=UPI00371FA6FB
MSVPKLNNNDDSYVLLEWLVPAGATVEIGQPIVAVETSKAIEELAATHAGVLRQGLAAGADCVPGSTIGLHPAAGAVPAAAPPVAEPSAWRCRGGRCRRRNAASPRW